jgi:hypothetical protein
MAGSGVTRRKVPTERNKTGKRLRFTPDDIVRAIAGVEAAGLQVYEIEITSAGAIKISTRPRAEASADEAKRESLDETLPTKNKKRAQPTRQSTKVHANTKSADGV